MLEIRPISFRPANEYVKQFHRHHGATSGCKWCIACYDDDRLCGVAICGRPLARPLDDGLTVEVTRLCTDGTRNACSMLYGACARVAKAMGYKKIITYILETENGASLRASGYECEVEKTRARSWNSSTRKREDKGPICSKKRFAKVL